MKDKQEKMKKKLISSNESEEERFFNAVAKCRNCNHIRMAHTFLVEDNGKCIDADLKKDGSYVTCNCNKYAPKDNLKYLEWEYERKQTRKKKKK